MHTAAVSPRLMRPAHTRLSRWHGLALVLLVLAAHVWLLAGSPSWLMPGHEPALSTHRFETRQIVREIQPTPTPVKATPPAPARHTPRPPLAATSDAPPPASAKPTHELEDIATQLTAPVALPERVAAAVDLPPFQRSASPNDAASTAARPPASARLSYAVQGQARQLHYHAWAELLWRQDGQRYDARLEVGAFLLGSRVQTSSGQIGSDGLLPQRFGDKTRSELAAHFQRDKGVISFSANTPEVPLLRGAQDRLSVVLQLSALLAADPERYPVGTMLSFQTVSQREAEVWQFEVEKPELLELPYGSVHSVKLTRKPRREFDQLIELWFAPELGYLPVRLRITNANGDRVDQQLKQVEEAGG